MSELFRNKYRIPTARYQDWDYAAEGMYFITICSKEMECFFGDIVVETRCFASNDDGKTRNDVSDGEKTQSIASLQSTEIGKIAEMEWYKSIELRPDMNIELAEFVVMPNHIHGIICIGENEFNSGVGRDAMGRRDAMHRVSTGTYKNKFGPQSKNIASIIRGYKSTVTNYARNNNIPFGWQPRFHDHIIRSMDEYVRISQYIINNPAKWLDDKFYKP